MLKRIMAKLLLIIMVLAGAGYWYYASGGDPIQSVKQAIAYEAGDPVELKSVDGRELECRILGKRGPFLLVERSADQQRFLLTGDRLSAGSRSFVGKIDDFNETEVNEDIFAQAKGAMTAEVLTIPGTCTFICPHNGERLNTKYGAERDHYLEMLAELGIPHREGSINAKKEGDAHTLPKGIKDMPCVRVGDQYVYTHNRDTLKRAYIDAYYAQASAASL